MPSAGAQESNSGSEDPEALEIPISLYVAVVRSALENTETPGFSGDHFRLVGDKEEFLRIVEEWLEGVVVDPDCLRHVRTLDWWESFRSKIQKVDEGLTQPKGWYGKAQALATAQENKYNGYVILRRFEPDRWATPLHEAIHVWAFGTDVVSQGLDDDKHFGPEFLTSRFPNTQAKLREHLDRESCAVVSQGREP